MKTRYRGRYSLASRLLNEVSLSLGSFSVSLPSKITDIDPRSQNRPINLDITGVWDPAKKKIVPGKASEFVTSILFRGLISHIEKGKAAGFGAARAGTVTEALTEALFGGSNLNNFAFADNFVYADVIDGDVYYSVKFFEKESGLSAQGITKEKMQKLVDELDNRGVDIKDKIIGKVADTKSLGIFSGQPTTRDGDTAGLKFTNFGPFSLKSIKADEDKKLSLGDLDVRTIPKNEFVIGVPSTDDINEVLQQIVNEDYTLSDFFGALSRGENPLDKEEMKNLRTSSGAYGKVGSDLTQNIGPFVAQHGEPAKKAIKLVNKIQKLLRDAIAEEKLDAIDSGQVEDLAANLEKAADDVDKVDGEKNDVLSLGLKKESEECKKNKLFEWAVK